MCDCTLLLKWHIGPNPEKLSDIYAFREIKDYREMPTFPIKASYWEKRIGAVISKYFVI